MESNTTHVVDLNNIKDANEYRELAVQFNNLIDELPENVISFDDADLKTVKFLKGQGRINVILDDIRKKKVGFKLIRNVDLATAKKNSGQKTDAAQNREAVFDSTYMQSEKVYQDIKNAEKYFENLYNMFLSAHQYYKGLARSA